MLTHPGEDTLVASWRALARLSHGAHLSYRDRSVAAVFPSWAPLNNAIMNGPTTPEAAGAAAAELAGVFQAAGVPTWALWLWSPLTVLEPPATVESVAGMIEDTKTLVMTRTLTPGALPSPAAVRTSIEAASLATDEPVRALSEPDDIPGLDGWVFVHEGAAVAGAWSYLHGTDCGLYAIGTVPHLRRRGLAAALIQHVLADAYRRGARTASLQSTRMGVPLYRSLGFAPTGRYEEWVPAATPSTP
ncbi:MAG TPA: GNAT family N-acetyltransferase [Nocardioides sp.]|jgi:GNAT superfamily N-acetyltransferase|nr:GNAT family N-acetyltransferase [Nocardioides sp.]